MGEPTQLPAPPPPPPGPFYRVVEVRANGSERLLQEFPYTVDNLADEQAKRATVRRHTPAPGSRKGYGSGSTAPTTRARSTRRKTLVADSTVNR